MGDAIAVVVQPTERRVRSGERDADDTALRARAGRGVLAPLDDGVSVQEARNRLASGSPIAAEPLRMVR